MALTLGIDTGGTYTDAVLFDTDAGVVASAKAVTTKHDLALGIAEAIDRVLEGAGDGPVQLVSISTTLATNAIVEGHGSPAGLVLAGYGRAEADRPALKAALSGDPVILVAGGHDAAGDPLAPLDLETARAAVIDAAGRVAAFAVSGMFAVRNPGHEIALREMIRAETGLPVTCAHELSASLDAPRRALTALVNARLIPLIHDLILAVEGLMADRGIVAPLMIVKGDGSLIGARTALACPVETILSGPAASVVGAIRLAAIRSGYVSDIGGTTTDIALIRDGKPMLNRDGARVAGLRTMVEAVAVHTSGLGGDSEVGLDDRGHLTVGPRRAMPLSLLAHQNPAVLDVLREQAARSRPQAWDGLFALRLRQLDARAPALSASKARLWDALADGPQPLERLFRDDSPVIALKRLTERGLVILAAITPSDAAHVLGLHDSWDAEAARLGMALWLRVNADLGSTVPESPEALARAIVDTLGRLSATALVGAALADGDGAALPEGRGRELFVDRPLDGAGSGLLDIRLTLGVPLIGIGAPAATYYDAVARRLHAELVVPPHAEVCNAVGAVAGGITQRVEARITQPEDGLLRAHLPDRIEDFRRLEDAVAAATDALEGRARRLAGEAGATNITVATRREDDAVTAPDGRQIFFETRLTTTATGRPRLANA